MARTVATQNQGGTYMKITAGKVRESAKEGDAGAVSRIVENKQTGESSTKWELVYDRISGVVKDVKTVKSDHIKLTSLVVTLFDEDDNDTVIIQCSEKSDYASSLLEQFPNVDFSKPIEIVPYQFTDKDSGKQRTGVTIYQEINTGLGFTDENKTKVGKFWTKDKPGDMPVFDPEDIEVWVIQRRKFLYKYFFDNIANKITGSNTSSDSPSNDNTANESSNRTDNNVGDDTDDLPF